MNLGFDFRQSLTLEGVIAALDRMVARINLIWGRQHDTDGGHTAITADSIVIDGTALDIDHVAYTNVANVFTEPQRITGDADTLAELEFNESNQPVDLRLFRIVGAGQLLFIQALSDDKTINTGSVFITRSGGLFASGVIGERSRTTPMGQWIDVPYNGSDYTAAAPLTWTVTAGQFGHNRYTLVGKTMTWSVSINAAGIGGVAAVGPLRVLIPGGYAMNTNFAGGVMGGLGIYHQGTWEQMMIQFVAGATTIDLFKLGAPANWIPGGVYVHFTVTFEIA